MYTVIVDNVKENLFVRTGINLDCKEIDDEVRPGDDKYIF
jgi:hypothetical protein